MSRRGSLPRRRLGAALLLGVALGACDAAPDAPPRPDPSAAGPLDGRLYAFCHEPGRLEPWERGFCALVDDEVAHRCPELAAACAAPAPATKPSTGCDSPAPPREAEPPAAAADVAFGFLGEVLRWTLALAVALGVAAILGVAARFLFARRAGAPPRRAPVPRPAITVTADAPIEHAHPAETLLERARAALDGGRFDEAVLFARGAALRGLADAGEVALHPSRTDREVLRTFKGDPARRDALRALVAAVEGVRWGHVPPAPDRARALVAAAARLVGAAVLALALLGEASAAPEHAPDGYAALVTVWRDAGLDARPRFRSLDGLSGDVRALFVDVDEVWLSPTAWERLEAWVDEEGGTLVLAGTPPDGVPFGYAVGPVGAAAAPTAVFEPLDPEIVPRWPGGPAARIVGDDAEPSLPVVADAASGAAYVDATPYGGGWLVRLPDGRILRNAAFVRPENEAFAHALGGFLRDGELGAPVRSGRVEVVVGVLAEGAGGPLDSLRNANLLPLVAQLLVVLALAAWWRGVPFGRPRDPAERARAAMRDHAAALGARYRALGATRRVAASLAALWLERLGAVGLAAAAERHGRTPAQARDLVARAKALADAPEDVDRPDDLEIVEELWTITRTP